MHIDRTVLQLDPVHGTEQETRKPFKEFDSFRGLVLLGDPGMGKTAELANAAATAGVRVIRVQEAVHRHTLAGLARG
jgi:hypothetical protein